MPRYFVHSIDASSSVFDDIGCELKDAEAARRHAVWCVRNILAHSLLEGYEVDARGYVSVQDIQGRECCRVPFMDCHAAAFIDVQEFDPGPYSHQTSFPSPPSKLIDYFIALILISAVVWMAT